MPVYKINSAGFMAPSEGGEFESPPANLSVQTGNGKDDFEKLSFSMNTVGARLRFSGKLFRLGTTDAEKPKEGANTGAESASSKTKPKETFKPLLDLPLSSEKTLVCLYPNPRNDWRKINRLAIDLDTVIPADPRALIINVSVSTVTVRTAAGQPATIAPGAFAFVPCRVQDGKVRIQAAASHRTGGTSMIANTSFEVTDGFLVLTFLNADPKIIQGKTVTFVKSYLDPNAAPEVPGTPPAKPEAGKTAVPQK